MRAKMEKSQFGVCLAQALNLPMRDRAWGCSKHQRGPCVIRRVGSLCPGGVRCGVSFDPAFDVGSFFLWCGGLAAENPRGGADPTRNQLSGGGGGRASSTLNSIDKASLRRSATGGSFVDGCGTAAQPVCRGLRLSAAGGLLLAAMANNSSRHTPRAYALARREALAPRREGACVTTLPEMPFGAQR